MHLESSLQRHRHHRPHHECSTATTVFMAMGITTCCHDIFKIHAHPTPSPLPDTDTDPHDDEDNDDDDDDDDDDGDEEAETRSLARTNETSRGRWRWGPTPAVQKFSESVRKCECDWGMG
ncbi:GL26116 [Drosophila persimilis]|uniref:GL26116 n=1 Tax=Drosophila persimilis TaxID=7234 RepID=B4GKM2_DROPE|nr:GL26116 [Drosophila persimilis]